MTDEASTAPRTSDRAVEQPGKPRSPHPATPTQQPVRDRPPDRTRPPVRDWRIASREELAHGLQSGLPECLEECFHRWASEVHTVAMHALQDRHDADEVTQEVFVAAWRSRSRFNAAIGSLPGWLIGITRHRISDVQRSRVRETRRVTAAMTSYTASDNSAGIDSVVDRVLLESELEQMSEPRQAILRAVYYEHRTYQEVADEMQLPLGTVKSHARRALQGLHGRLNEVGHEAPQ